MQEGLSTVPEVRLAGWHAAMVSVLAGCCLLGMADPLTLAAVGLVTVASGTRLRLPHTVLLGLSTWGFYTGFVVNELGALTFSRADLMRLALLLTASTAAHWQQ